MSTQVNIRELGALIKAKRGSRGLRAVSDEIQGVSASTLSRIEQGKVPDLDTFMRLCRWLGESPEKFMENSQSEQGNTLHSPLDTPKLIAAHLRADRTLDPATADALAKTIQLAYDAATRGKFDE